MKRLLLRQGVGADAEKCEKERQLSRGIPPASFPAESQAKQRFRIIADVAHDCY